MKLMGGSPSGTGKRKNRRKTLKAEHGGSKREKKERRGGRRDLGYFKRTKIERSCLGTAGGKGVKIGAGLCKERTMGQERRPTEGGGSINQTNRRGGTYGGREGVMGNSLQESGPLGGGFKGKNEKNRMGKKDQFLSIRDKKESKKGKKKGHRDSQGDQRVGNFRCLERKRRTRGGELGRSW